MYSGCIPWLTYVLTYILCGPEYAQEYMLRRMRILQYAHTPYGHDVSSLFARPVTALTLVYSAYFVLHFLRPFISVSVHALHCLSS